jgi:hypothetical protein
LEKSTAGQPTRPRPGRWHAGAVFYQQWLKGQKHRLQTQQINAVLAALQPHLEPVEADELQALVRRRHRYLSQRLEQLDKKLGLTIVSDKPQGGERVYRIA